MVSRGLLYYLNTIVRVPDFESLAKHTRLGAEGDDVS